MSFIYNPTTPEELLKFYFAWVVMLMLAHIIWDWRHPKTPDITVSRITSKINEIYSSASTANSFLLCSILLNGFKDHPLFSSDAIYMPLVLASIVGMAVGVRGLEPTE